MTKRGLWTDTFQGTQHSNNQAFMSPEEYRNLYLCEFPPPLKVGDGAIWKGRNVIIRAIEPDGERDRAIVQDFESGRERNVHLSCLLPLNAP